MDVVILAGGIIKPDDPLQAYTATQSKALIDINGRSMLERVVDAFHQANSADRLAVVGNNYENVLKLDYPIHFIPDQNSLIANILSGVSWVRETNPEAKTLLISTSDIPAVTPAIIDDFVERCQPFAYGTYYNVVTREAIEARFPGSKRSYVSLRDIEVAGGDIFLLQSDILDGNEALLEALTNARKHAWRLARIIGFVTLLKFLTGRLTIEEAELAVGRLAGRPLKAIVNPHAELAMDADKPHQVDMLRKYLSTM